VPSARAPPPTAGPRAILGAVDLLALMAILGVAAALVATPDAELLDLVPLGCLHLAGTASWSGSAGRSTLPTTLCLG